MTHQPITAEMTREQRAAARSANHAGFAANLRAYAARQEARAPGRMAHITGPLIEAASLCDAISAAYASGDKEALATNRDALGRLSTNATVNHAMFEAA